MSAASTVTVWQLGTGEAETATAQQMQGAAYMLLRQLATLLRCYVAAVWHSAVAQKHGCGGAASLQLLKMQREKHSTPTTWLAHLAGNTPRQAVARVPCRRRMQPAQLQRPLAQLAGNPQGRTHRHIQHLCQIFCLHACQTVPVQLVYTSVTPACFPQKTLPLLRRPAGLCATSCT